MIQKEFRKVIQHSLATVKITCDCCGKTKEAKEGEDINGQNIDDGTASLWVQNRWDDESQHVDLCTDCGEWLIKEIISKSNINGVF